MEGLVMEYKDCSIKELLSLTLRESNSSVVEELLQQFSSLRDLALATTTELQSIKGLGPCKVNTLKASLELGRRLYCAEPKDISSIRSPQDIVNLFMNEMRYLDREHLRVVLLNTKNQVLRVETVSIGTLNTSAVHPREIFKSAIKHSAAVIILVHNHPSGDPTPSNQDMEVTKRLSEVGSIIGIEVLDHLIVGDGIYVSFKEKGLLT